MRELALLLLAGCSTVSLRAGAVVAGGKPAFQATVEIGTSFGTKRLYELTHEFGVQANSDGAALVSAFNADVVTLHDEHGPIARIGPRMRGASKPGESTTDSASLGARATFYTGMFRDAKSGSGGIGVELAGGIDTDRNSPVFEASIIMHARQDLD